MSSPTWHPNMSDMVLLVHATLQWHSMGEKQSKCFTLGDIFSSALKQLTEARFLRERCLLWPLRLPPAPPLLPAPPPAPPPMLLLPALTIHCHSLHHSIIAGGGGGGRHPVFYLHPGGLPLLQLHLFLHPLLSSLPAVDWLAPLFCALAYPPRQSTRSVAEPRFTGEPQWNHGVQI